MLQPKLIAHFTKNWASRGVTGLSTVFLLHTLWVKFLFEVIIEAYAFVRNDTERSHGHFIQIPSETLAALCTTILQLLTQSKHNTFITTSPFKPTSSPPATPGNYWTLHHFCIFVISRMLYKWNHMLCNFGDWLFSLSIIFLRLLQVFAYITICSLLLLSSVPWYGYSTLCLAI